MEICVWQYRAALTSALNGTSGGRDLSKEQTGNDGYIVQGSRCTFWPVKVSRTWLRVLPDKPQPLISAAPLQRAHKSSFPPPRGLLPSSCISLTWRHSFSHSPGRQGRGPCLPQPGPESPAWYLPNRLPAEASEHRCHRTGPLPAEHGQQDGFITSVWVIGCQCLLRSLKAEGLS